MDYFGFTVYPCGQIRGKRGKMLKHAINKQGYHWVDMRIKGVRKNMKVHRLVAMCYLENPENKATVNHTDNNTHNNDLTNLTWMTMQENNAAKFKMQTNNTSGIIGVSLHTQSNLWLAQLTSYGKVYSKYFKTKDEAIIYRKYLEDTYKK